MRAINIAFFIFLVSLGASLVNEIGLASMQEPAVLNTTRLQQELGEVANNETGWWSSLDTITIIYKSLNTVWNVISSTFTLGSTVNNLFNQATGISIPSAIVLALNGLSVFAGVTTIISILRGVMLE